MTTCARCGLDTAHTHLQDCVDEQVDEKIAAERELWRKREALMRDLLKLAVKTLRNAQMRFGHEDNLKALRRIEEEEP